MLTSGAVTSGSLATPLGILVLAWEAEGLVCLNLAEELDSASPEGRAPAEFQEVRDTFDEANPGRVGAPGH
jgi:hypothetical protein